MAQPQAGPRRLGLHDSKSFAPPMVGVGIRGGGRCCAGRVFDGRAGRKRQHVRFRRPVRRPAHRQVPPPASRRVPHLTYRPAPEPASHPVLRPAPHPVLRPVLRTARRPVRRPADPPTSPTSSSGPTNCVTAADDQNLFIDDSLQPVITVTAGNNSWIANPFTEPLRFAVYSNRTLLGKRECR